MKRVELYFDLDGGYSEDPVPADALARWGDPPASASRT